MARKKLSKAAQAAMKAAGVEREAPPDRVDVLSRLQEIDPGLSRARENRFAAEIARIRASQSR